LTVFNSILLVGWQWLTFWTTVWLLGNSRCDAKRL